MTLAAFREIPWWVLIGAGAIVVLFVGLVLTAALVGQRGRGGRR
jgi:hypothetical protein